MAFRKIYDGIKIIAKTVASSVGLGELEVLNDNKLHYHNGTTSSPVVTEDHAATLENKNISFNDNIITDMSFVDADINASAAIQRSKLASGTTDVILANDALGVMSETTITTATLEAALDSLVANSQDRNIKLIEGGTWSFVQATNTLTWDADAFIQVPGCEDDRNEIVAGSANLPNPSSVLYVELNKAPGSPQTLTPLVGDIDSLALTDNTFILARNVAGGVVVGDTTLLPLDTSKTLYSGLTDETLSYLGITDESDSSPTYTSDIRGVAGDDLTARLGVLTDAIGDAQEDRSSFLRSDEPVSWDGSQLSFTSDIILENINTKVSNVVSRRTVISKNLSPITIASNYNCYFNINRTAPSASASVTVSSSVPSQEQSTKDYLVLARAVEVNGKTYLHLPFSKQLIEPGQKVRLGATGGNKTATEQFIENNQFIPKNIADLSTNITEASAYNVDYSILRHHLISGGGTDDYAFIANSSDSSKFDSDVYGVVSHLDGYIVFGNFVDYGAVGNDRLVRLNADGTIDAAFTANSSQASRFNDTVVRVIVQPDGKILVGGAFNNYDISGCSKFIRLNADGTFDSTFSLESSGSSKFNNTVSSIALGGDGSVYVGGAFTDYAGISNLNNLIKTDSDGYLDTVYVANCSGNNEFNGPAYGVYQLVVDKNNALYAAGDFVNYGGTSGLNSLVKLDANGNLDTSYTTNSSGSVKFNSYILALALDNSDNLLVGGRFTDYISPTIGDYFVKLNSDGTANTPFTTAVTSASKINSDVRCVSVDNAGNSYIGGDFTDYAGVSGTNRLIKVDSSGVLISGFVNNASASSKINTSVYNVYPTSDGSVFVSGTFTDYGFGGIDKMVKLNGDTMSYLNQTGKLSLLFDGNKWEIAGHTVTGSNPDVTLTVTPSGQMQYTSSLLIGTPINSYIRYLLTAL